MKRFINITLSLIIILSSCGASTQIVSAYSVQNYTYDDIDTLIELIEEQISNMDAAHQMAEAARTLGYSEDHQVIQLAVQEYEQAYQEKEKYQAIYDDLNEHWQQKREEYPVATYIWSYLKDLGYNNQVCAGILGNIMTEVGGNTLDIQYTAKTKNYYGICQWNKAYSSIWDASLWKQLNFLEDTIKDEIDTFGYVYKQDFNYDDFTSITNVKQAAKIFAICYERCNSKSYKLREQNAIAAYNYFVS